VIGALAHMTFFVIIFGIIETEGITFLVPRSYLIYIGAGLGGLGDASFTVFTSIIISKLFRDNIEAAFAVLKFSQSLGAAIFFSIGAYLNFQVKLVILLGFLCLGLITMIYRRIFIGSIDGYSKY